MTRTICGTLLAILIPLGMGRSALSQAPRTATYETATLVVTGAEQQLGNGQWDSGTFTVSFGGHSETVSYGQFSTATAIAAGIAAKFSQDPISSLPHLCTLGICAKVRNATITFEITSPAVLSPLAVTVSSSSFGGVGSGWPTASSNSTSIVLSSSGSPAFVGSIVAFTAAVSPSSSTGYVTFLDGSSVLGTTPLSGGYASLDTAGLSAGLHSITAIYSGDDNDLSSTSAVLSESLQYPSTTVIMTSTNPSSSGQTISFTVTVMTGTGVMSSGSISIYDGNTIIGSGSLSGTASYALSTGILSVGMHTIYAVYNGSGDVSGSTSQSIQQNVRPSTTAPVAPYCPIH